MGKDKLIIGLTGLPGSGKSLVVKTARELGFDVIVMGDVVREETANRGLEPTPANVGTVMLELRETNGPGVIAKKCIPKIELNDSQTIVIDGLRSYVEAEIFMKRFSNFILVTVHSPPKIRFERLSIRNRSDDPKDWKVFKERDKRELGIGIGNAIAQSEYVIINDGTIETLNSRAREVLKKAEENWKK